MRITRRGRQKEQRTYGFVHAPSFWLMMRPYVLLHVTRTAAQKTPFSVSEWSQVVLCMVGGFLSQYARSAGVLCSLNTLLVPGGQRARGLLIHTEIATSDNRHIGLARIWTQQHARWVNMHVLDNSYPMRNFCQHLSCLGGSESHSVSYSAAVHYAVTRCRNAVP